jgi:hypothetical protein
LLESQDLRYHHRDKGSHQPERRKWPLIHTRLRQERIRTTLTTHQRLSNECLQANCCLKGLGLRR